MPQLLAEHHLGRLAIPDFGGPVIFPVNYVIDWDLIVFRINPGTKLDAACAACPCTLGAGRQDPLCAGAAALGHRPAHTDPRRPALHLVGLTGRLPVMRAER